MIHLQIADEFQAEDYDSLLEEAASATLAAEGVKPEAELTIVVTDDKRLQQLNRDYLEIDAPTDVLSFPSGEVDPETGKPYLGDVLISFPQAAAQAEAGGHPVEDELKLLVVHGVLHLLGFDHVEEEEKERMWAAQTQILNTLGLTNLSF